MFRWSECERRAANNVVIVVAADSIGRFPDLNLADSLGRVSGLSIERDHGEARTVNVRGTPSTSVANVAVDSNHNIREVVNTITAHKFGAEHQFGESALDYSITFGSSSELASPRSSPPYFQAGLLARPAFYASAPPCHPRASPQMLSIASHPGPTIEGTL